VDLGINSLAFIKVVVGLENEFDIEFEDNALDSKSFTTIGSIAEYIKRMVGGK